MSVIASPTECRTTGEALGRGGVRASKRGLALSRSACGNVVADTATRDLWAGNTGESAIAADLSAPRWPQLGARKEFDARQRRAQRHIGLRVRGSFTNRVIPRPP